ncbi:Glycoside hydrolase family 18 protein [Mycena indigotica]|uniref:chitinase n=1 Tax=Mycena indigotica TaxID=2126181 RepID=A0A8H6SYG2_9AGAR|nr:Glycoside hydrolase family 18 protein [Mycena indigotica]KAF7306627.1 Glycoside hydrolase family 18 protein [Mycena indigotica]
MALRFVSLAALSLSALAFDNSRYDNVAVYWGQNSVGANSANPPSSWQKPLAFYCNDNAVDVFPIAFVNVFFSTGGLPSLNLANTCNPTDNATFPGSSLPNCASLASDIQTCQSKGKLVTLSLGGATGGVGFSSDDQGTAFAQTIWNLFLGGSSSTRPFGSAVLDGVDLDIESGGGTGYVAFVNKIRSLASGASKKYYITAAPQCPYPDAALGTVINAASFDAVYVQFYNNQCGLNNYNIASDWDFGLWDYWARNISPNKNVKVYLGAPASSGAAGSGYVDSATLSSIAVKMRKSFSAFGGVMLWDESQAYRLSSFHILAARSEGRRTENGRFDLAIKNALVAAGGTGFTFPACSAPAYSTSGTYTAGTQVSYQGYIWQAKWWTANVPSANFNGDWAAVSACGGTSLPPSSSSTTTSKATSSTKASSTTSSSPSGPTNGVCTGIAAWSSSVAYTGGSKVTYNSHLWTAQWWTQADTPGGSAGVWIDNGACASLAKVATDAKPTVDIRAPSRFFRV